MKKIISYILVFILISCQTISNEKDNTTMSIATKSSNKKRILFVTSNAHFYGDSDIESTNHFPEIIFAYEEFIKEGFQVDFVSPNGGEIAVGYIYSSDTITKKYLYDASFMDKLQHTKSPIQIDYTNYAAVYYTGGGSAMFTVPESKEIKEISMNIYEKNNGIISAICHGTAGIIDLQKEDGSFLISSKNITGFPDVFENKKASYYQEFPFSIQEKAIENGGVFKFSKDGWDNYYLQDDRIITGQDPTSASIVAKKVIETIRNQTIY
ncbi:type 1 glutamine amidotransferase domain-containing protein [Aquimarina sp. 2201CG14-23]|uniref:type 1 glutamine amidotransferase domain-containing protein n=1 Tax=Aquimarina mycalae TaxID=3040073 RepID=UPI002477D910|nr:type 1 glutamine amidotransferase domain-containing protein [Aquimarina sp. 2201CG14-23]MDH7444224.1 type 1 glutamine amidotransferase domain-containing protein [Aquimarina sp. 2201CG14-23]